MQPSTELESLVRQFYEKEASGELFDFAKRLYSRQDGVIVIGTDPNEWFEDYNSIISFYEAATAAVLEIKIDNLKAYCEGAAGWAVDRLMVKLHNDVEIPVRHTYIFQKENGAWKIVHMHDSVAVPNDKLGT